MSRKIAFSKYQGAGNDFILIDNRNNDFDHNNHDLVARMCDRRFGIGADGLMLLEYTKNSAISSDFDMVYYNADGQKGSMCGNGGRCIVAFARDLGVIEQDTAFMAVDGMHHAAIQGEQVQLGMIDVDTYSRDGEAYILQTGSPHYVEFVKGLAELDVFTVGGAIRNNATYKSEGINVNFVEQEGEDAYFCRTFERGVEDETFACGTGATAAAMAIALQENREGHQEIAIRVLGGQLRIAFEKQGNSFTNVFLHGPAEWVFQGEF
ncbi:diaminopimelate epimerase [Sphingobacterium sp. lm-10]|uniref:diaminopimelate epimerase n=1 Tax=Sphingobacterium sp. lm-10 TaxID=2944904 RepID=UPI0020206FD4|nr:diaminopimelate epimerase [Sphingobacterium sp. lm-10]MCL7988503.1 diaminopimelate epimerase [Sphingobacterium sp. lm-10]